MKSTTTATTTVALSQLIQSESNVRRTGRDEGVAALAASIAAHGLLQNLTVRLCGDKYEVIAGQRRLLALQSLVAAGTIPTDYTVACNILSDTADATEISLAENELRVAMHPADQFVAFKDLADGGMSNEDIAARFGITPAVVTRRLKLASVAPSIMESYRAGNLDLEHVMAFTISNDQAQQERVYKVLHGNGNVAAWRIKSELTAGMVETSRDKMAKFVGLAAYDAAGGPILRDLFSHNDDAYLQDGALLKRLYDEKFAETVEAVEGEGWAWVESWEDNDYTRIFDSVKPDPKNDEEDEDIGFDEEDLDAEDVAETDEPIEFTSDEKARSGAIVRVDYHGKLEIRRGLIERKRGKQSTTEAASGPAPEFSAPMTRTLTQHRTAAMRMAMLQQSNVALRALAHNLVGRLLLSGYVWDLRSCISIDPIHHRLDVEAPEECRAHAELQFVIDGWKAKLPEDKKELWAWLMAQDDQTITDLIVLTTAMTAFGVSERAESASGSYLIETLGIDMRSWWTPSLEGFLSRMKKSELCRAVREVGQPEEAARIEKMKKAEATGAAARALDGTQWIPATLSQQKQEG